MYVKINERRYLFLFLFSHMKLTTINKISVNSISSKKFNRCNLYFSISETRKK